MERWIGRLQNYSGWKDTLATLRQLCCRLCIVRAFIWEITQYVRITVVTQRYRFKLELGGHGSTNLESLESQCSMLIILLLKACLCNGNRNENKPEIRMKSRWAN